MLRKTLAAKVRIEIHINEQPREEHPKYFVSIDPASNPLSGTTPGSTYNIFQKKPSFPPGVNATDIAKRYIWENYGPGSSKGNYFAKIQEEQERRANERSARAFEDYAAGDPARAGLRRPDDSGEDVGSDRRDDGPADGEPDA